jgi:hypothetical protein
MANSIPTSRSAGVTAAATFAILASIAAVYIWWPIFIHMIHIPPDARGQHVYQKHPLLLITFTILLPLFIALAFSTGLGLVFLKSWARKTALLCATLALIFALCMIAYRPYETFYISENYVAESESFQQILAISFVFFLLPLGIWWLLYFTRKNVIAQFRSSPSKDSSHSV